MRVGLPQFSTLVFYLGAAHVSFEDKTLTCRDCGTAFIFTAGEQEFYAQKGFDNEPTRCRHCRQLRKAQRTDSYSDRASSGSSYSARSQSSGSYSAGVNNGFQRERIRHETVCSQCGRLTTVPFIPRGDRPVYCNECFSQQRASRTATRGYNRY
jgi:CxxC-x17-CxxC domain-containing protein